MVSAFSVTGYDNIVPGKVTSEFLEHSDVTATKSDVATKNSSHSQTGCKQNPKVQSVHLNQSVTNPHCNGKRHLPYLQTKLGQQVFLSVNYDESRNFEVAFVL